MKILESFDLDNIPDLDIAVFGALELFERDSIPHLNLGNFKTPLVIGSGNALSVGKIIYRDKSALFADEDNYKEILNVNPTIDGAVIVSASGGKSSTKIAEFLSSKIETVLLTNNPKAPSREFINSGNIFLFPKNREPYTYNVSTYLGMILSKTGENPRHIREHIESRVSSNMMDDFAKFNAIFFILPTKFKIIKEMFMTKFEELFGPNISSHVDTLEEAKHGKTVIESEKELFISFDKSPIPFGTAETRLQIPVPDNADYGAIMAIGYYVIGRIQKDHPPYFKENIESYAKTASSLFREEILPIVE